MDYYPSCSRCPKNPFPYYFRIKDPKEYDEEIFTKTIVYDSEAPQEVPVEA
jgi:small subunit ribosomal protein S3e